MTTASRSPSSANTEHEIRTITVDGNTYRVSVHVGFDGVEHIGRLWFTDDTDSGLAFLDHGAVPGSTAEDVVRKAQEFTEAELSHRCHRALAEKRRFGRLRRATDELINQIKYLNRVVINLQAGMLDREGGLQEIAQIQNKLLEIVRSLPIHAGVEDEE